MCVCVQICAYVCEHRFGMLLSSPIPPCQYLLSILRFEERQLVSIFMDVVKHLNPPTLSKSRDSMRAHAPTDG